MPDESHSSCRQYNSINVITVESNDPAGSCFELSIQLRGNIEHEALDRTLRLSNSSRTHSDKERLDKDLSLRSRDRTSHLGPEAIVQSWHARTPDLRPPAWSGQPLSKRPEKLILTGFLNPMPLQFLTDLEPLFIKFLYINSVN